MRRLRDFESVVAFLSEEEMDGMQAAIDARREARAEGPGSPEDGLASPESSCSAQEGEP